MVLTLVLALPLPLLLLLLLLHYAVPQFRCYAPSAASFGHFTLIARGPFFRQAASIGRPEGLRRIGQSEGET